MMAEDMPEETEFRSAASEVLGRAAAARVTPGAVLAVGTSEAVWQPLASGSLTYDGEAVTPDTLYDLASLTKVVACLPALLKLLDAGEITLDQTVRHFFSNAGWFQEPSLGDVTLEELTLHSSGLPAWTPLFAWVSGRDAQRANVLQSSLSGTRGEYDYSDLGVMILGMVIERVTGEPLDAFVAREVFAPLGMHSVRYGPLPPGSRVAPTEDDGWRGRLLAGEVHDENAWSMGGVSAHAGLFGTVSDVLRYARAWLRQEVPFCGPEWLREAVRDRSRGAGPPRGILWRLNSDNWPVGKAMSDSAYGHTGFTGTSILVDPVQDWACVLLTNRVHPRRGSADGVMALRREIHALVAETFGAAARS